MKTGLLSLHAPFADAIFEGTKHYEYRRKAPQLPTPTRFLIYVTAPRKELVGEIVVDHILTDTPANLWKKTGHVGGIARNDLMAYFDGLSEAHALHVQSRRKYTRPVGLQTLRAKLPGGFTPPQYLTWLSPKRTAQMHALA